MKNQQKIALAGATGKIGKPLLNSLLQQGYQVKALIRKPESFLFSHPSLEIVQGDLVSLESTELFLRDCNAVISTIGQVKDEPMVSAVATSNIVKTMLNYGIQRYLLLAGLNLDVPGDSKSTANRESSAWMRQTFPEVVADKQKAYDILSRNEVDWTLFRLPWIVETDERAGIIADLQDCPGKQVYSHELADFMIGQLNNPLFIKKAPFVASKTE